jgi:hypothetical protein
MPFAAPTLRGNAHPSARDRGKLGELQMAESGERDTCKGNRNPALKSQAATPKLADLVSRDQSSRWQQLADVPK